MPAPADFILPLYRLYSLCTLTYTFTRCILRLAIISRQCGRSFKLLAAVFGAEAVSLIFFLFDLLAHSGGGGQGSYGQCLQLRRFFCWWGFPKLFSKAMLLSYGKKSVPKLWKSGLTPPPSYFIKKVHNFWTQKKCPKAMDWPRPPPLRKNSIKKQQPVARWLPLVGNLK